MRAAVIGAGVVGLAVARALARAGNETLILEREPRIATGVTSRNSGVIHAPIHYATGSLKATLCARGRELLYEFCDTHGVAHRQTGKLIVASNQGQLAELERIRIRAAENGAPEIRIFDAAELAKHEPHVAGVGALLSPRTGIVDAQALARALLRDAQDHGASLAVGARVEAAGRKSDGFSLRTSLGPMDANVVVNAAGLFADDVAALMGAPYTVHPWRGDYFVFQPDRPLERLVYPVKDATAPGLGVHLTLDLQGRYRLGPDVELVTSKTDFTPREAKHARFLEAAQRLFPWARAEMLRYDTCGIRPKLRGPEHTDERDFVIRADAPGWINLVGIESPGLTASLAIAERVLELV
ncbi:MAG: NAD(P)/FAD-dependent oxidoreductase [Deltaproteobacteria bacterium]|nr:NAD(P)/FAD-dependent oxidoreductase [Deltaproteobacteria bacterium]